MREYQEVTLLKSPSTPAERHHGQLTSYLQLTSSTIAYIERQLIPTRPLRVNKGIRDSSLLNRFCVNADKVSLKTQAPHRPQHIRGGKKATDWLPGFPNCNVHLGGERFDTPSKRRRSPLQALTMSEVTEAKHTCE